MAFENDQDVSLTRGEFIWLATANVLLAILFSLALVVLLLKFSSLQPPETYAIAFFVCWSALYPISRVWNRRRHRRIPALAYFAGSTAAAVTWALVWHVVAPISGR